MSSRKCASLGTSLMHSGRTPTMRAARMCALWLVAHVHGGAFRVPCRFVRRNEGVHAGSRAAAGQQTTGADGIAEPSAKPVDHHELDLTRPARNQPSAGV